MIIIGTLEIPAGIAVFLQSLNVQHYGHIVTSSSVTLMHYATEDFGWRGNGSFAFNNNVALELRSVYVRPTAGSIIAVPRLVLADGYFLGPQQGPAVRITVTDSLAISGQCALTGHTHLLLSGTAVSVAGATNSVLKLSANSQLTVSRGCTARLETFVDFANHQEGTGAIELRSRF